MIKARRAVVLCNLVWITNTCWHNAWHIMSVERPSYVTGLLVSLFFKKCLCAKFRARVGGDGLSACLHIPGLTCHAQVHPVDLPSPCGAPTGLLWQLSAVWVGMFPTDLRSPLPRRTARGINSRWWWQPTGAGEGMAVPAPHNC